jgi:hypothetical protein
LEKEAANACNAASTTWGEEWKRLWYETMYYIYMCVCVCVCYFNIYIYIPLSDYLSIYRSIDLSIYLSHVILSAFQRRLVRKNQLM